MPAITVTNTEYLILAEVVTALEDATIGGSAAFNAVHVATEPPQFDETSFVKSPVAAVQFVGCSEDEAPGDDGATFAVNGEVRFLLHLASKSAPTTPPDRTAVVREALRLVNAARNAVRASPPSHATACGDGNFYRPRMVFGEPVLESVEGWAMARLPLTCAFTLTSQTAH